MSIEHISKGQYYRNLKDKVNDVWDRISFWTHADDVELDNGDTLSSDLATKDIIINNLLTDFAPIETAVTASRVYSIGQCLIRNNQFYKAITDISVGDNLVEGTNIQTMTASEISYKLTASDGGAEFYFDRYNNQYGFYPNSNKIASEFIPFNGGLLETPLWENPSPNLSFSAQDIVVGVEALNGGYDYIKVAYRVTRQYDYNFNIMCSIEDLRRTSLNSRYEFYAMYYGDGFNRRFALKQPGASELADAISFSDCAYDTFINNTYNVPLAIYGLK